MSAIAGRVLILPKGDYDALATYEFLDLVNHNSSSWLAKKASQGIEPSDTNAEFWQKFGSSVTPDGVTIVIDENGVISAVGGTAEKVTYENESVEDVTNVKEALDGIFDGTQQVGDSAKLGGKDASEYALDSDFVRLTGAEWLGTSILEKALTVENGITNYILGGSYYAAEDLPDANYKNSMATILRRTDSIISVIVWANGTLAPIINNYINGTWFGWKTMLTTGNKPSGTYTGNGSSTQRTIATGGIGNTCILSSVNGMAIVTEGGAFTINISGSYAGVPKSQLNFANGQLTMASSNSIFNANGTEIKYQVP